MLIDKKDVQNWIVDVNDYNKKRRERGFENPKVKIANILEIQKKEKEFNPILQKFLDPQKDDLCTEKLEQRNKYLQEKKHKYVEQYDRNYDILNLDKLANSTFKERLIPPKQVLQQSLRDFNIINHTPTQKFMYENVKILSQEKPVEQKIRQYKQRDFNILSNKYLKDNEQRIKNEQENIKKILQEKFVKTHHYNFIEGKAYDENQEQIYNKKQEQKIKKEVSRQVTQLPPSIRYRETIIFDRTKPIPEEIKLIDQKRQNAKIRFQLRYAIENEYHKRNLETLDRKQQRVRNGMFEQKYIDEHKKGFDLITLKKVNMEDIEKKINKKTNVSSWEKVLQTRSENMYSKLNNNEGKLSSTQSNVFNI